MPAKKMAERQPRYGQRRPMHPTLIGADHLERADGVDQHLSASGQRIQRSLVAHPDNEGLGVADFRCQRLQPAGVAPRESDRRKDAHCQRSHHRDADGKRQDAPVHRQLVEPRQE